MSRAGQDVPVSIPTSRIVAVGLLLTLALVLGPGSSLARAQSDNTAPAGSTFLVANTDGLRLNLRAGPTTAEPILARLMAGETLTALGSARTVGATRWLHVRSAAGLTGWVSAEYVVLTSPPVPPAPHVAELPATATRPASTPSSSEQTAHDSRREAPGKPVEVEAKLKFPEVQGRDQEITVWVTRDGVPIPGAIVTLESNDGDDGERFRQLDPTNADGRTRRSFDVRHEKGTVELQVEAVAPDGGEGRTIVSYFRR